MNESISLLQRFFRLGMNRPLPCLAVLVLLCSVAIAGLSRLKVDVGAEPLMRREDPQRQAYLRVVGEFGSDRRGIVVLRDRALWRPEKLAALERLHDSLRRQPFVERVDDVLSLHAVRSVDGQLQLRTLAGATDSADEALRMRQELVDDPLAVGKLLSADGHALAIVLTPRITGEAVSDAEFDQRVEQVLAPARSAFDSLVLVGPSRVEAELRSVIARDGWLLAGAGALLLGFTVWVLQRQAGAALRPLFVAAIGLLWTAGLMGWIGVPIGVFALMLAPLALAFAARDQMRMQAAFLRCRRGAVDDRAATLAMLGHMAAPLAVSGLVTAAGFAIVSLAGTQAVRDFGMAAALAILANTLAGAVLGPMFLAAHGARVTEGESPVSRRVSGIATAAFAAIRRRGEALILAAVAALCALAGLAAANLAINAEPLGFLRHDHPLVRESAQLQRDIAGHRLFFVTLEAGAEGAFRDPANLQRLADIQGFIGKQQVFDRSLSLADLVAAATREAAGGQPDAYRIPQGRQAVAQILTLYRPHDLQPYVSTDFRRANIVVRHNVRDSSTLNRHVGELRQVLGHYAGADFKASIVGENLAISEAAEPLPLATAAALLVLLALVFVVVSVMFTSIRGGIISLVPCLVLILGALGLMRAFGATVDPASPLVAAVAVAAAVDGTIHLFARYANACRGAANYALAVLETIREEAPRVVAGSLAMAVALACLGLSDSAVIAQFGLLAATVLALSVVVSLTLTPLVMSRIRLIGLYEILSMSMPRDTLESSPLFHGMSAYQIRKAILISELREVADGERLIEQGAVGRSMYFVVSGELAVVRRDGDAERQLARLGPGEVIGEIGFVQATRRTADVRALGPVSVLRFDHTRMEKDLALFPHIMAKLSFNISGILGRRLADLVEAQSPPAGGPAVPDAAAAGPARPSS